MKKLIILTSLLLITITILTQADTSTQKKTTIKFNSLSIFREGIEGSIEKSINKKNSFEFAVGYNSWSNKTNTGIYDSVSEEYKFFQNTIEKFNLYNLRVQFNHYLFKNKNTLTGFYIGPYLKLSSGKVEYEFTSQNTLSYFGKENDVNLEASLFSVAMGSNIGYQINIANNITLGAFLQIGYKTGKANQYYENKNYENEYSKVFTPLSIKGFDSNLGINLGIVL